MATSKKVASEAGAALGKKGGTKKQRSIDASALAQAKAAAPKKTPPKKVPAKKRGR